MSAPLPPRIAPLTLAGADARSASARPSAMLDAKPAVPRSANDNETTYC
ncbi:MAG: hypothetical protein OEV39_07155 [Gammaproteobacteria bacterium]|nr:hypothetical protein [Gammaproteobacteria bacterium]MDH5176275.1 hypothetical protein [Gammaproteobacteria bacterium]